MFQLFSPRGVPEHLSPFPKGSVSPRHLPLFSLSNPHQKLTVACLTLSQPYSQAGADLIDSKPWCTNKRVREVGWREILEQRKFLGRWRWCHRDISVCSHWTHWAIALPTWQSVPCTCRSRRSGFHASRRVLFVSEVHSLSVFVKQKKVIYLFLPCCDNIFHISHFCAAALALSAASHVLYKL